MKNKLVSNALWIIVCKVVQSLLGLVVYVLSARYLGPSNYGLISYAASVVAFVVPIMQLGLRSTLVQECIERPEETGKTIGTALCMNLVSAIVCMVGAVSFVSIANAGELVTRIVCVLYSLLLIFQALEMVQYWFQAKLLSKYPSIVSLVAYFVVSAYKIFLLITQKSIYWFAVSQAIDSMLISIALLILYRRLSGQRLSFSLARAKQMFRRSRPYILAGLMVTIFQQTDRLMLKNMVGDTATGYYSVAVACAGMTSFVFAAIIDSVRPVVLEAKKQDTAVYERRVTGLFSIIFYLSLLQCVGMTLLAEPIIYILYGDAYAGAVNALRIVVWYETYSYFGSARNIWILAEEKQSYLWIINLCGAGLNVLLNFLLIPYFGVIGAAFASFCTQFFTNFILGFIIKPIRPCNRLMLRGMDPRCFIGMVKQIVQARRHRAP